MHYSRVSNGNKVLAVIIAIVFVFTSAGLMTTAVSHAAARAPKSITLKASDKTIFIGDQTKIRVSKAKPAKASKKVTWSVSDEETAEVSKNGVVTGLKTGKVKVTATSKVNRKIKKSVTVKVIADGEPLSEWIMTPYYAAAKINNKAVEKNATALMYNPEINAFRPVRKAEKNIIGNYVRLTDTDKDKKAELIRIVAYEDGSRYWDDAATWVEGAGTEFTSDEPLDDATGASMFAEKQRIPYGERLLTTYGLKDWSGTTDWSRETVIGDDNDSIYYENTGHDWYNQKSNDTLTILTGYKTTLQTTGYNCVMSSALSVLEWYGERGDLNEMDLASLRGKAKAGQNQSGTSIDEDITMYRNLYRLGLTCEWEIETWNDDPQRLYDSEWIQDQLAKGHPIGVIWNSFGAHGQVIIGYDNMGTDETNDDVLIMMDPYDTTDQNPDGYIIQSYERLCYGLLTWGKEGTNNTKFISVYPKDGSWDKNYKQQKEAAVLKDFSNKADFSDKNKMAYGYTAKDIQKYYKDEVEIYDEQTGLSGAAGVERSGDSDYSPYYKHINFAQSENAVKTEIGSKTLKLLDNFQTIQQSSEYTCGCDSALLTINWFGKNAQRKGEGEDKYGEGQLETDISLCHIRQDGEIGATFRKGVQDIFDYMSSEYGQKWITFSNQDLDDPYGEESYIGDYCLQAGAHSEGWQGLIPYLIDNDIPMMIGSDEWGGHWQVIVGYDGLGTEGTQDDVLIIADPYDTTDHNQDGYVIKGFERLVYGWGSAFEAGDGYDNKWKVEGEQGANDFVVAIPDEPEYADVISALGLK